MHVAVCVTKNFFVLDVAEIEVDRVHTREATSLFFALIALVMVAKIFFNNE